jgi:hypothetical protein
MSAEPLDQLLRLVAEGRLSAEEAAPILAALDETMPPKAERGVGAGRGGRSPGSRPPGGFGSNPPPGFVDDADPGDAAAPPPRSLRIEVREAGRQVVNVRLPIAVGRFALERVPGLSGEQVDRVREAMHSGFRGPVLVVDEGDSGVRILLE